MLFTKLDWQGPGWYSASLQELSREGDEQDGVLLLVDFAGTGRQPKDTLVPAVWCYQEGYAYSCWSKVYRWWGAIEAAVTTLHDAYPEEYSTKEEVDTAQDFRFSPKETHLGRRERWLSHLQSGRKYPEPITEKRENIKEDFPFNWGAYS